MGGNFEFTTYGNEMKFSPAPQEIFATYKYSIISYAGP